MRKTMIFAFAIAALLVGAGVASAATGGPDAYGYTWDDSEAYVWNDISGTGTELTGGDEEVSALIGLGFNFAFYGHVYAQTQISINGHVTFDGTTSYELTCDWSALPIHNWIGKWADLITVSIGHIYYQTVGSAPNRKFVVQYQGVPIYGEDSNTTTFQIVLEETTNDVVLYVQDGLSNPANANQLYDATGIANGETYLQYSCDTAIAASKAIRFSHPTDFFQVTPEAAAQGGAPGASVTYTVTVFNFLGASEDFTIAATGNVWNVTVDSGITVGNNATGTFDVTVDIPGDADFGDSDTVSIDVSDSKTTHSAVLTTTASCDLALDDGSYEIQIGFNSANIGMCASVFTVAADTDITNVKVMFSSGGGIANPAPFKICFFAATVAGGPTGAAHDCSGPYTADDLDVWYEADLPAPVTVTAGDFAVATWQTGSFYSQAIDQAGPRMERGWISVDTGSSWVPQDELSSGLFAGNFLLRPSFCEVTDDDDDDDNDDNDDNDDDTVDDDTVDDDTVDDDTVDDDTADDDVVDDDTTDDDDDDDLADDDDDNGGDDDDDSGGCGC
jgi:hypothetical protein